MRPIRKMTYELELAREPNDDAAARREALERQRIIGSRLRTIYTDVTSEPIPEDLSDLLDELEKRGVHGRN
jgi:hypothetical protein